MWYFNLVDDMRHMYTPGPHAWWQTSNRLLYSSATRLKYAVPLPNFRSTNKVHDKFKKLHYQEFNVGHVTRGYTQMALDSRFPFLAARLQLLNALECSQQFMIVCWRWNVICKRQESHWNFLSGRYCRIADTAYFTKYHSLSPLMREL